MNNIRRYAHYNGRNEGEHMNPLNRQWFYRDFHRKLTDSLGKDTADRLWEDAGKEYSRILAAQPELKKHKGAMTLPAVALYRVLTAGGEDAEGLLNAYGEYLGKRFARIIHALTSLPGADRLVWRHVGSVMEKASSEKLGYRRELVSEPPDMYGVDILSCPYHELAKQLATKRPSCASAIWTRSILRGSGISATTVIVLFRKEPEPVSTGCGLIPRKIEVISGCALSQWARRRFRRFCLSTAFPQQQKAATGQ